MAKFKFGVLVPTGQVVTARVGTVLTNAPLTQNDIGKFVKLTADSQYDLCAAADPIQGVFLALDPASQDGFAIGSVQKGGRVAALANGLQATAGTGTIAVGDYVLCSTIDPRGTALTTAYPKVVKATVQPGAVPASTVATANTAAAIKVALDLTIGIINKAEANALFAWRVVAHIGAGTGAVGNGLIIERVNVV